MFFKPKPPADHGGQIIFKNFKKHVDIISNTDIIRVSNKKNQIGGQENENL